jgi:hypothetical protein
LGDAPSHWPPLSSRRLASASSFTASATSLFSLGATTDVQSLSAISAIVRSPLAGRGAGSAGRIICPGAGLLCSAAGDVLCSADLLSSGTLLCPVSAAGHLHLHDIQAGLRHVLPDAAVRRLSQRLQDLLSPGALLRYGPRDEGRLRDRGRGLLQDGLVPQAGREADSPHRIPSADVLTLRPVYGVAMRAARHHAGYS